MIIVKTTYDGFFIVKTDKGKITSYEGFNLCPRDVQVRIMEGKYIEINCFYTEAISYGYI